jgi:ABC-type phosphate/phosphonate transport system substrate-binding protein
VTSTQPSTFASLAMYPFAEVQPAWEALYAAVAREVPGAPTNLRWDVDPHDAWLDPGLALGMACGWPLITSLRGHVQTAGAFVYELDGSTSHLYRSVIVAREPMSLRAFLGSTAAINGEDSLSGCVSLLVALGGERSEWPGPVMWTGAHVASIEAVSTGRADVACIDALTWAYLQREHASDLDGLIVIDRGPTVPTPPLIINAAATVDELRQWRTALAHVVQSEALRGPLDTLLIRGFVPLDTADYDAALIGMGVTARAT